MSTFRNLLLAKSQRSDISYIPHSYLVGDGVAYIDTLSVLDSDTDICVEYVTTVGGSLAIFGVGSYASKNAYELNSFSTITLDFGGLRTPQLPVAAKLRIKGEGLYIDDVFFKNLKNSNFSHTNSFYIFRSRSRRGKAGTKIARFTISKNDVLVRDFIPCELSSNIPASVASDSTAHRRGELGMWDLVNQVFYADASHAGTFSVED